MSKAFNYTGVQTQIKTDVVKLLKEVGNYKLVAISKYSSHPADNYLYIVMAKGGYREGYNTWIYNTSLKGLFEGSYDMDYPMALVNMGNRVR